MLTRSTTVSSWKHIFIEFGDWVTDLEICRILKPAELEFIIRVRLRSITATTTFQSGRFTGLWAEGSEQDDKGPEANGKVKCRKCHKSKLSQFKLNLNTMCRAADSTHLRSHIQPLLENSRRTSECQFTPESFIRFAALKNYNSPTR